MRWEKGGGVKKQKTKHNEILLHAPRINIILLNRKQQILVSMLRNRKLFYTAGDCKIVGLLWKSLAVPQKVRVIIHPSIPLLGSCPSEMKLYVQLYRSVISSITQDSKKIQTTSMSIKLRKEKQTMIYPYSEILFGNKKKP